MATTPAPDAKTGADRPASLDLALIGNCAISALVDREARVVWCCMPRFDGDPVFHALLDSGRRPAARRRDAASSSRASRASSRATSPAPRSCARACSTPRAGRRDHRLRAALLHITTASSGRRSWCAACGRWRATRASASTCSRAANGAAPTPAITRGSNHLRYVLPRRHAAPHHQRAADLRARRAPGSRCTARSACCSGPTRRCPAASRRPRATSRSRPRCYWRHWTRRLALPLEWQEAVIRAAITLKLCQFEETGAIVAAMTTSIPEAPDSGRNWDYRFCWLRDAFFVVRALNSLSEVGTMEDYLRWLYDVVRGAEDGHVQPLYGIGLERELTESIVPHLAGLSRHGPGARRQPGLRALPARRLRQHRARRGAGLPRPPPVPPRRRRRLRARSSGRRAGLAAARPARRRHVGAAHPGPRPHVVVADVLGGVRPAREDRAHASALRERAALWRERADDRARARSSSRPGTRSGRRSSRASAATTSTPACC